MDKHKKGVNTKQKFIMMYLDSLTNNDVQTCTCLIHYKGMLSLRKLAWKEHQRYSYRISNLKLESIFDSKICDMHLSS